MAVTKNSTTLVPDVHPYDHADSYAAAFWAHLGPAHPALLESGLPGIGVRVEQVWDSIEEH